MNCQLGNVVSVTAVIQILNQTLLILMLLEDLDMEVEKDRYREVTDLLQ